MKMKQCGEMLLCLMIAVLCSSCLVTVNACAPNFIPQEQSFDMDSSLFPWNEPDNVTASRLMISTRSEHDYCACGISPRLKDNESKSSLQDDFKIETANSNDYPWMVLIKHTQSNVVCTGTIINTQFILAPAHCLAKISINPDTPQSARLLFVPDETAISPDDIQVWVNVVDPNNLAGATKLRIEKINLYPTFTSHFLVKKIVSDDVALLQLLAPLTFDDKSGLAPVCLPLNKNNVLEGRDTFAIGWRTDEQNVITFEKVSTTIYSIEDCRKKSIRSFTHPFLCAGNSFDNNIADMFSGAPLFVQLKSGRMLQVGLALWNNPALRRKFHTPNEMYSLFSKLDEYVNFVHYHAKLAGAYFCGKAIVEFKEEKPSTEKAHLLGNPWDSIKDSDTFIRMNSLNCVCGVTNPEIGPRIIGGTDASRDEFPWQAQIIISETLCGGTVINNLFILTAAHCVAPNPTASIGKLHLPNYSPAVSPKDVHVLLYAQTFGDSSGYSVEIEAIYVHPGWISENVGGVDVRPAGYYDYDVALLQLKTPLEFKKPGFVPITPVCIPRLGENFDDWEDNDHTASVTGWGLTRLTSTKVARTLQKVNLLLNTLSVCRNVVSNAEIRDRFICAGNLNKWKDAASGDSGGPLIVSIPQDDGEVMQSVQIGIVSHAYQSERLVAGLYQRLTNVTKFIEYYARRVSAEWCRRSMKEVNNDMERSGRTIFLDTDILASDSESSSMKEIPSLEEIVPEFHSVYEDTQTESESEFESTDVLNAPVIMPAIISNEYEIANVQDDDANENSSGNIVSPSTVPEDVLPNDYIGVDENSQSSPVEIETVAQQELPSVEQNVPNDINAEDTLMETVTQDLEETVPGIYSEDAVNSEENAIIAQPDEIGTDALQILARK